MYQLWKQFSGQARCYDLSKISDPNLIPALFSGEKSYSGIIMFQFSEIRRRKELRLGWKMVEFKRLSATIPERPWVGSVCRNKKNKLQGVTYIICASFFQSAVRKWKWVFTNCYASEILTPPCISGYISAIYLYISLPALGYNHLV